MLLPMSPSKEASIRLIFWPVLKRCALLGAGVDVLLLTLFYYLDSPVLAWVNILGVTIYLAAYYLLMHGRNRLAVSVMRLEVLGHSTLGILMLGWDSGAYYYMLLFIPLIVASAKPQRTFRAVTALWIYYLGLYIACQLWLTPLQPISHEATLIMHSFSITIMFVMLTYLSHLYVRAVRRAQDRLRWQAITDSLTGLYNRRQALEVAHDALDARKCNHAPLSLIVIDIDHFKHINDTHGHDGGDQTLRAVSEALRQAIRPHDTLARWGGEEFLVILPNADLEQAREVAERLRQRVETTHMKFTGGTAAVSVTLGVSEYREDEGFDECIARADGALYKGKRLGRNQVVG
ncbi:GGDEF domain-containing protein [Pseudomonas congelans]|uniref:GGDEF domain-containing protein n=1 Tax=Pseudomonas congelans TaxID=200452 RepID=UPI001F24D8FF|nr:GGDEF domain-containing protein [Pseudomonas congelans]